MKVVIKKRCLLEYNYVQSVESQQTFRKNILFPSSGLNKAKNTSTKQVATRALQIESGYFQRTQCDISQNI